MDAVAALLATLGIDFGDLTDNEILPSTLSQKFFDATRADLNVALAAPRMRSLADHAIDGYLPFASAFEQRGDELSQALVLFARARAAAEPTLAAKGIFARVSRYLDVGGKPLVPSQLRLDEPWIKLAGHAGAVTAFTAAFEAWRSRGIELSAWRLTSAQSWDYWKDEVGILIASRTAPRTPAWVRVVDVIHAAANLPPGNLFRLHLGRMDQVDWSRAALAGLPRVPIPDVPRWVLFAALHQLQFGRDLLERIDAASGAPRADPFIDAIIKATAPSPPAGLLKVFSDRDGAPRRQEIEPGRPVLLVGRSAYDAYVDGLAWLAEHGAFAGGELEDG
jgi:hypothetical protein